MELKYSVQFSGCNCGCSPSKNYIAYGNDFQEMKMPLARIYFGCVSDRNPADPFYKVGIEKSESSFISNEQIDEIKSLALKMRDKDNVIYSLKSKIKSLKTAIKTAYYHARCLDIQLPEKNLLKVKEQEKEIEALKAELSKTVSESNLEFAIPAYSNVKVVTLDYDEDENEESEIPVEFGDNLFTVASPVSLDDLHED